MQHVFQTFISYFSKHPAREKKQTTFSAHRQKEWEEGWITSNGFWEHHKTLVACCPDTAIWYLHCDVVSICETICLLGSLGSWQGTSQLRVSLLSKGFCLYVNKQRPILCHLQSNLCRLKHCKIWMTYNTTGKQFKLLVVLPSIPSYSKERIRTPLWITIKQSS